MNHDPRRQGGQEYAPQAYSPPDVAETRPPTMRPAPQAYAPPPAYASTHEAEVPHAQPQRYSAPAQTEASPAAVAAATGSPPASSGELVVKLSRPYLAHNEEVRELHFRKPVGGDAVRCGYPVRMVRGDGMDVEYKVVPEAVSKLIVALASPPLPRSTVDAFEIRDWNACSSLINSFFLE